jgi:hypothetical protein
MPSCAGNPSRGEVLLQFLTQTLAVASRHVQVGDNHIRLQAACDRECVEPIARLADFESCAPQHLHYKGSDALLAFHDQPRHGPLCIALLFIRTPDGKAPVQIQE